MRNISLEDAMDKIRLWEQARDQVTEMTRTDVSTNAVGPKKAYGKTFFSCGKEGHFSRDRNCSAKGRKCSKCSKCENMAISLAVARVDLSSILPRQSLQNSLLFITVVLDSCFVEREEEPTLLMRLQSRVKIIHLLLL